ncbi:MFS transporter [Altererythrobacter sp. CC-YST694]|uniref:spinster family MFS transporter n=1 Tax=Altererythrobacter sp. CC-YST694 TaxID=2755038 RepID=UPI001D035A28|nr:MFS transporter [Altererythrobacter sp. CC-YST694]MCB5425151.1 MFS transporter [Altererythrobacter sp. CC-YST694]
MTQRDRAVALLLLASLNAFGFIDRVVVALVAEKIKAEFLVSDFQIGLLGGTAFAVVNALASVPVARMAENYRRSTISAGFLLIGSAFTAFMALTVNFTQLLAARLGMAVGSAATEAPPHSMISDMYPPEKRASAISIFMLGVPVASLLGSFLGGAIAENYDWRSTFLFFGVAGGIISLLCFLFLKEPARATVAEESGPTVKPSAWQVFSGMMGSSTIRFLLVGVTCISLGSFGVNTFLPAFFSRSYALDAGQAGLVFGTISGVASLVGTLLGGFASEYFARRDQRWLLGFPALGSVLGAPLFVIGLMSGHLAIAIPVMLVGSFFFYTAMGPAIATLHGNLDSWSRATGSAIFLLIVHLVGQGVGPPLVGTVSDTASSMIYGGNFAALCAGAAGQVPGSACAAASAGGLQMAIATFAGFFALGGLALYLAARARHRAEAAA